MFSQTTIILCIVLRSQLKNIFLNFGLDQNSDKDPVRHWVVGTPQIWVYHEKFKFLRSIYHKGLGLRKVLKKVLKKALKKILLTQKRTQKSKCTFLSTQKSTQ